MVVVIVIHFDALVIPFHIIGAVQKFGEAGVGVNGGGAIVRDGGFAALAPFGSDENDAIGVPG